MAASVKSVREGIAPLLMAAGVDLEDLQVQQAGRREIVRLVVDRDGGVDLDLVSEISRQVSAVLDAEPLSSHFDGTYVLEVTSPGVDRPLTELKHWRRAVERLVEVQLLDGTVVLGRITAVDGDVVTLDVAEGKTTVSTPIPLSLVELGRVQIEFNRMTTEGAKDGH
ncbi:MAG: ribosome maturation factor RimP [Actinomycetota bacterium]|nr:ribosome maturation factor RimP [Actinomycetota bacterium]MDP2288414.1 ribosome maturation factor RimP [Actinomycetota bacterium]